FQAFHLLPYRTALENVLLAGLYNQTSRGDRIRAAAGALDAVGLGHRLDALPTTLSCGECQRVAIARALVNRPSLLLCGEPTTSATGCCPSVMRLVMPRPFRPGPFLPGSAAGLPRPRLAARDATAEA